MLGELLMNLRSELAINNNILIQTSSHFVLRILACFACSRRELRILRVSTRAFCPRIAGGVQVYSVAGGMQVYSVAGGVSVYSVTNYSTCCFSLHLQLPPYI